MKPFKIPPQIVRLLLLTVGIVVSYLVARYFLTPASFGDYSWFRETPAPFGQYGWFRANAMGEIASLPRTYAGRKACEECHDDEQKKLSAKEHKNLSCEGCHGPAKAHADNPDIKPDILNYSHCIRCHEANPSRPKTHKQIASRTHYPGQKCTECHVPHQPTEVP